MTNSEDAPAPGYSKFRQRAHGYPLSLRKESHGQYEIYRRPTDYLVRYSAVVGDIGTIRPIEDIGKFSSIHQVLSVVDAHHASQTSEDGQVRHSRKKTPSARLKREIASALSHQRAGKLKDR